MSEEYLKGLTKEELINIIDEETSCTYQLKEDKELLKRENQRLKEKRDLAVQKANEEREKNVDLEIKLDLYKSVINELRELITVNTCWDTTTKKAFEILSKVEGSDSNE